MTEYVDTDTRIYGVLWSSWKMDPADVRHLMLKRYPDAVAVILTEVSTKIHESHNDNGDIQRFSVDWQYIFDIEFPEASDHTPEEHIKAKPWEPCNCISDSYGKPRPIKPNPVWESE